MSLNSEFVTNVTDFTQQENGANPRLTKVSLLDTTMQQLATMHHLLLLSLSQINNGKVPSIHQQAGHME